MDSIFNIGFNSSCSDTSETATVPDRRTSYNATFTLHGCNPPSGVVTANLLREGTNVDSTEEGVTVSERPTVPEITISRLGPSSIDEGQSARFIISASPAPSSNLVVNIDVDETGSYLSDSTPPGEVTISGGSSSYTLSLPTDDDSVDEPDGEIEVTIESDTSYRVGAPPSASVDVEDDDPIPPSNIPPTVASQISDKTFTVGDAATTIVLEDKFSDPDGDTLTYTASSSNTGVATASVTGSSLTLTPVAAGTATITVTARDRAPRVPGGLSVSQSLTVTVTLAAPTGLAARDMIGGRGITVEWNSVTGADEYQVKTSFNGGSTTTDASTETISFIGLTPGATYSFEVRACKKQGMSCLYSPWSTTVNRNAPTPTQLGHQEDHTVEYEVGSITPAPGLPSGIPDPATVIRGFDKRCRHRLEYCCCGDSGQEPEDMQGWSLRHEQPRQEDHNDPDSR